MGSVLRPGKARRAAAIAVALLLAGCQAPQQRRYTDLQPMVERSATSRPVLAIAIVGASYLPDVALVDLASGEQGSPANTRDARKDAMVGVAAGAAVGAVVWLGTVAGAMAACLTPAAPATCTAFWSFAAGGAVVGAGAGLALGKASGERTERPNPSATVVRETPLQDSLRAAVAQRCGSLAAVLCAETHFPGPGFRGARPDYAPLAGTPADAVLEVEVLELSMSRGRPGAPAALTMLARARLVRAAGGEVLYRGTHRHASEVPAMDAGTGDDARKLLESLQTAIAELAGRIVDAALAPERAGRRS